MEVGVAEAEGSSSIEGVFMSVPMELNDQLKFKQELTDFVLVLITIPMEIDNQFLMSTERLGSG